MDIKEERQATNATDAFVRLGDILNTLRKECPWDREQTMKSLRYLTIEEVYELSEAIVAGQKEEIKKELGDLAMHILFYCKIAEEQGLFSTTDVYNAISEKLIARHPFIYQKEDYHGEGWEQLKMREGRKNVLEGVPNSLPSLVKAVRIQEKVAGMSQDNKYAATQDNVLRRLGDMDEAMNETAFGDLLFALIHWARQHGINADNALCEANNRFLKAYSTAN